MLLANRPAILIRYGPPGPKVNPRHQVLVALATRRRRDLSEQVGRDVGVGAG
jgi:hypothetical protein